jgi:hypothetical protein
MPNPDYSARPSRNVAVSLCDTVAELRSNSATVSGREAGERAESAGDVRAAQAYFARAEKHRW